MLAALLLGSASLSPSLAQETGSVSGRITDAATLEPVAAARVHVLGTLAATLTDHRGEFSLGAVPAGNVELRVERLGYAPVVRQIEVGPGEHLVESFDLEAAAIQLDEVLVTATGVQRRRELGNATAVIRAAEEVERALPTSVMGLLQGRASGVQVLQSSGTVGTSGTIKVRGNSSIGLSNTPLVYIDGARVSNSMSSGPGVGGQNTTRLGDLNPEEIEAIEIVRGPSAATLYGTEAAAGVIRITTKRGRTGTGEWTFRSELGGTWDDTSWPSTLWHPRSFFGEELDLADLFGPGSLPPNTYRVPIPDTIYQMNLLRDGGAGEDHYGTPWRTGRQQTYGVTLRGGSSELTYFLSGELSSREGSLPNNGSERRNVRANFNFTPSPRVDVAVSTSFASTQARLPDNDNNAFGYLGVAMLGSPWNIPIRRGDLVAGGEVITCPLAFEMHRALVAERFAFRLADLGDLCADNPFFSERTFGDIRTLKNEEDIERFVGSATLDYRPLDFLNARGTLGYDQYSNQTGSFVPVDTNLPFDEFSRGFRSIGNTVVRNLTLDADVSARFQLTPELRSTTSAGAQFFGSQGESASSVGRVFPTGTETVSNAVRTEGFESVGENRTIGLYVQQQVGFRDRLFLTPAVRFDQNSAFGRNLGWETYPRVTAAYLVSEEPWFPRDLPLKLASLRLRGAWGESGKQPSAAAALQLLAAQRVAFQGVDVPGVRVTRPGNPDLAPERGQEVELGFEADLLGGRLGVDFTWFNQLTLAMPS